VVPITDDDPIGDASDVDVLKDLPPPPAEANTGGDGE
jgi:hypothetical protein